MSEESKSDYVDMDSVPGVPGNAVKVDGLDDDDLSQEDKDLRLAIALQQQENAAVYDAQKKRHEQVIAAQRNRTTRSNVNTGLGAIRKKDHGKLSVPKEYSTPNAHAVDDGDYSAPDGIKMGNLKGALPQEVADAQLASELQKLEEVGAGTARLMEKISKEESRDKASSELRNARSGTGAFKK